MFELDEPPVKEGLELHPFGRCRDMYNEWRRELKTMANRLVRMRQELVDALRDRGKRILISMIHHVLNRVCLLFQAKK